MKTSDKITEAIQHIIMGLPTQYIMVENESGDSIKIRVANHMANPGRMDAGDLSLVLELPEQECEDDGNVCSRFFINKKTFRNIPGQFFLDESGNFTEHFRSIEEFLNDYNIQ